MRIANQDSAIISTDYDRPSIKDVWIDNPSNPVDPTELSSRGNETIVFTGVYVSSQAPARAERTC